MDLTGRTILITGAGARIGHAMGLAAVAAGANVVAHYRTSADGAEEIAVAARDAGQRGAAVKADLSDAREAAGLLQRAVDAVDWPIDGLINSASVFENVNLAETTLETWRRNMEVHLTAPFLLSQAFYLHRGTQLSATDGHASIVNMLDHRALRPGADHFAYTISKSGLAAMTRSLAQACAPRVRVNGVALGLILPAVDGSDDHTTLRRTPARRAGTLQETIDTVFFLLGGPTYITGEIVHVDGGRHLT